MGKTYFIDQSLKPYAKSQNTSLEIISSDKLRRALVDRYLQEYPGRSEEEAMSNTASSTSKKFMNKIVDELRRGIEQNTNKKQIIYLDKNHPPNIIQKTTDTIRKYG
jgi:hypothetical protein